MDERYWDPQLETLPVERRRQLQDHRLRWQVRRCWDASPFYRAHLEAAGIHPTTFGGLAELTKLPILRLADLPRGQLAGEASDEWTVAPGAWWQRRERWDDDAVRVVTDGDAIQQAHQAARALWAAGSRPGRSLAAMASEQPGGTAVGIPTVASVVAHACPENEGDHWLDDYFLIEVISPSTGTTVEDGTDGALVVTDLAREGSPLLRFSTGWGANFIEAPCACGRTSSRSTVIRRLGAG